MTATIKPNPAAPLWLFDFDNTLAALERQVDWAASRVALETFLRGERIDEALFTEFPTRNLPLYNGLLMRLREGPHDAAPLMRQASAIIESFELHGVEHAAPLTGALELLAALQASGKRLAVVTSNSSRTVARWLTRHSLTREVGPIVGRDSLLPLKPAPDMIRQVLQLCDARASDAVLVGDSEADLMAAQRTGVGFLGVAAAAVARARLEALGAREVFVSPAALALHLRLFGFLTQG